MPPNDTVARNLSIGFNQDLLNNMDIDNRKNETTIQLNKISKINFTSNEHKRISKTTSATTTKAVKSNNTNQSVSPISYGFFKKVVNLHEGNNKSSIKPEITTNILHLYNTSVCNDTLSKVLSEKLTSVNANTTGNTKIYNNNRKASFKNKKESVPIISYMKSTTNKTRRNRNNEKNNTRSIIEREQAEESKLYSRKNKTDSLNTNRMKLKPIKNGTSESKYKKSNISVISILSLNDSLNTAESSPCMLNQKITFINNKSNNSKSSMLSENLGFVPNPGSTMKNVSFILLVTLLIITICLALTYKKEKKKKKNYYI